MYCTVSYWPEKFNKKFAHSLFLQKPKPYGPKGLWHKIFENHIWFGRDIQLLNISAYAQPAMKSIPRMLSQRWNSFHVCSECDEIRSAYAQHGCTCKNCSHFTAGWACAKIRSSYAHCAFARFHVYSACAIAHGIIFENNSKKPNENANFDYK